VVPARPPGGRTFFWFERNRHLAKDLCNLAETLAAFVTLASIQLAFRRLARASVVNSKDHGLEVRANQGPQMGW
jgi:hypothetical protein